MEMNMTKFHERLQHPRPQMIRTNWTDLNGLWDFCFDDDNSGLTQNGYLREDFFDRQICVPYAYQTRKSLIDCQEHHPIVWYRRPLAVTRQNARRYLLHFEAVDYASDVFVDGHHLFHHEGGHTPFVVDVTEYVHENAMLYVRAQDFCRADQPIGKQSWKQENFLCWYTRTTGIWQQVWLEETGEQYLREVRMIPDIDNASLDLDLFVENASDTTQVSGYVSFRGQRITSFATALKSGRARISVDVSSEDANFRLHFWSPADPNLYDIEFEVLERGCSMDLVRSYFGMRDVSVQGSKVFLNNQELYQRLVLDQGYWSDGGLTATPAQLLADVQKIREMGFNGARKHQKIEDARYMYLCDVLGLVMWAEMPSFFEYSHISNENVMKEFHAFVAKHINHPSVIAYTLMNESWGVNEIYKDRKQQAFVNGLYWMTRSLDSSRLVIGNDGWEQTMTDIVAVHDYNSDPETLAASYANLAQAAGGSPSRTSLRHCFARDYGYSGQPFMISEFGGVAYDTGTRTIDSSWGYGNRLEGQEAVLEKMAALCQAVHSIRDLCGFCYTQLSDVEQEVNGLLDHNHEYKFDPAAIREMITGGKQTGFLFL
ncbi:sugar-binding domain-containing protein [uncultured Faecalibaculum sp.]|uniref:sugar-binding domain-containing protein n=2 Tax=uncultured Faecalibaculum sp. TaxID=1729681 RepID=UPI002729D271|nr:sugar-binding domain-containing protein [uncultured Faecalibaculum sp.]